MSKKKRRGKPAKPTVPEIPDSLFAPLVRRLDRLITYHRTKWPDGVNPNKSIHPLAKEIGPAARAYKAGVRAKSLYDKMREIERFLNATEEPDD
jgi:hypothetical protein